MIQKIPVNGKAQTNQQHFCRLQQAQRLTSLGSLAGSIAHDFNTLLVSILGYTELTLEKLPEDDPVRKNIEEIRAAANSAAELSNQMMLYSDNTRCEVKPTDLNKVISDVGRLLSVSISKNIRISYELTNAISPVEANSLQIQQVLMNLIVNASDAIGKNSGSITICSGVDKPEPSLLESHGKSVHAYYCYVKVIDTGCGMDPATRDKVFDAYFTTKANGHGLGMAAVAKIVESLHGVIQLDTKPGAGTTFTVWLPCSQQPCECSPEQTPNEDTRLGSGTVLVVDDEPDVLTVTKAMLEHQGFGVLTAKNGKECLDILSGDAPVDIVLLDMMMPGISTNEILQQGHRLRPNLRVVLCSGCDEHEAMKLFNVETLSGYVQKPFSLHGILAALLRVKDSHIPLMPQATFTERFSATI